MTPDPTSDRLGTCEAIGHPREVHPQADRIGLYGPCIDWTPLPEDRTTHDMDATIRRTAHKAAEFLSTGGGSFVDKRPSEGVMRTFTGYRPKVPEHYIDGGYGNQPDEAQFQGVQFTDGTVAVRWLTEFRSTSLWQDFDTFQAVHGHADYETRIEWSDA